MFSPTVMRSLVYAGLLSNLMALLVCFGFEEYEVMVKKSVAFVVWYGMYLIHKKLGTW